MRTNVYISRRTDAQSMADQLVKVVLDRASTKYGCADNHVHAFAVGYLNSLLAQVAAQSPASLKELGKVLKFAKENK